MKKLIILLIRLRLGLKRGEWFQFTNQKTSNEYYYFTDIELKKVCKGKGKNPDQYELSGVSLNWLLSDDCEIKHWGL